MIIILVILIILELLTFLTLAEHFSKGPARRYFIVLLINIIGTFWIWIVFIKVTTFRGDFDEPQNVVSRMNLTLLICAVLIPRFIMTLFHFTGRLIRIRKKDHSRPLTRTGIMIGITVLAVVITSTLYGRFNFRTEKVTVNIEGLDPRLEGLKIVQLSDMHLASFYRHKRSLEKVIGKVNSLQPDLIINTGDFVSYGWREFGRFDTILAKSVSRYGNLAILGNHDMGTYLPDASEAERKSNILRMKELVTASGYRLLDNENIIIGIRGARIELAGVETAGRFPKMIHSEIDNSITGTDSAELSIILIHDPNQWKRDIAGKTDFDLALAGHTHGMQIGIITRKIRWSPAKYIYPEWNGLFTIDDQYLYVNRGLGVLGAPFRIWMPPEITLLTLTAG